MRIYYKKLGLKKEPVLMFTEKGFNHLHEHGAASIDEGIIYININEHDSASELIDTVVHELMHISQPKLKHGKKFQEKINNVVMSL